MRPGVSTCIENLSIQIVGGLTVIRHSRIFVFIMNSDNLEEKCPSWNNMIEVDGNMYMVGFRICIHKIPFEFPLLCLHRM